MTDIEIVVFQDKSWVRLTEYQKAKEECEQLQQKWLESDYEKSKLVSQIEKMKRCENCKHSYHDRYHTLQCLRNCINSDKWELAE